MSAVCGALEQDQDLPAGTDLSKHTVLTGIVKAGDEPLPGAYVRLLDSTGEFTGEVVSSATGQFRFFAAPGQWTIRALHRSGTGQRSVTANGPGLYSVEVSVS
jgi:hypothetical protein